MGRVSLRAPAGRRRFIRTLETPIIRRLYLFYMSIRKKRRRVAGRGLGVAWGASRRAPQSRRLFQGLAVALKSITRQSYIGSPTGTLNMSPVRFYAGHDPARSQIEGRKPASSGGERPTNGRKHVNVWPPAKCQKR